MPAERDPGKRKPHKKVETLRLDLEAPASPRHVIETAQMFHDALLDIAPGLRDDDVTLVISNLELRSELRGHTADGRKAVSHVGDLLENPSKTLEQNPTLYLVASTIAKRLMPLVEFAPKIYRGRRREAVAVLGVTYTKTLQAMGQALRPNTVAGGIVGETVTYSPILRYGRQRENSPATIRIRLGAGFQEIPVEPQLARVCADLTVSGKPVPVRVRGRWVEGKYGFLELQDPVAVSIDCTFEPWSGADLLQEMRTHVDAFGTDDVQELLARLNQIRGN
jgi:hypothetical protein